MIILCILLFVSTALYAQEDSLKNNFTGTTDNIDLIAQVVQAQTPALTMTEDNDTQADDAESLLLFACCAAIISGLFSD